MSPVYCGIDFGTSNSEVGVSAPPGAQSGAGSDGVTLVPLEGAETSIPTALFFEAEDARTLFGRAAIGEYTDGVDGRLMRSIKSVLGTSLVDDTTNVGGRSLSYATIISVFLKHLRGIAREHLGREITQVVLGRPVHFVDDDAERDRRAQATLEHAAKQAGFRDVLFQFEPIAAAFDYERSLSQDETVLVVDIGGGTSDFTVIRLGPSRRGRHGGGSGGSGGSDRRDDVLATSGVHLGGTDFDTRLSIATAMRMLGLGSTGRDGRPVPSAIYYDLATWHRINLLYSRKEMHHAAQLRYSYGDERFHHRLMSVLKRRLGHRLAGDVERSKIMVADHGTHALDLGYVEAGLQCAVDEATLARSIADDLEKIVATAGEAIRACGLASPDTLYFTGGSTAMKALRDAFAPRFPGAKMVAGDLFGSVARGLAVHSRRVFG